MDYHIARNTLYAAFFTPSLYCVGRLASVYILLVFIELYFYATDPRRASGQLFITFEHNENKDLITGQRSGS